MHIEHNTEKGLFYIEREGKKLAIMTYTWLDKHTINIEHTVVDDILKGQGVGKQLVEKAVEFARKKNLKIVPSCPFTRGVFDKTPNYNDVMINSNSAE